MPADDGGPGLVTAFLHLANRDLTAPDDSTAANGAGRLSLTPSTGTFELDGVAPGSYELLARVADPAAGTGLAGFSWGRTSVDIVDQDINGVSIAVNPSVVLRGTVRSDSGTNPGSGLRVGLIPMGGSARIALYQLIATRPATVGPDGSFVIMAVPPGSFRVGAVSGLPADSYIADVRQNARSVFDSGFDVGSQTPDPIEIVISSGATAVDGFVRDALSGSASGATVALVPGRGRIENRALYHSTISDRSGHFTFRGVAPGEYQLFAWANAPRNADQSPSFFRMYEGQGRVVHLDRNAAVNMDITVIK